MKKIAAGALAVAALAVVVLGASTILSPRRAQASDPSAGRYIFIDTARSTQLLAYIDPSSADYGKFAFAVQGLGLFANTSPATVSRNSDNSVVVTYDGPGLLDASATLDFVFGMNMPSGRTTPVPIQLQAQINPDHVTSSAQLWVSGVQYKLVDKRPVSDPTTTINAAVGLLRQEDWGGLYDMGFSQMQRWATRDQYIGSVSAGWASAGTITGVTITGPVQLNDGTAGYDMAAAPISVTLAGSSGPVTYTGWLKLINEPAGWRLYSIDKQY